MYLEINQIKKRNHVNVSANELHYYDKSHKVYCKNLLLNKNGEYITSNSTAFAISVSSSSLNPFSYPLGQDIL